MLINIDKINDYQGMNIKDNWQIVNFKKTIDNEYAVVSIFRLLDKPIKKEDYNTYAEHGQAVYEINDDFKIDIKNPLDIV